MSTYSRVVGTSGIRSWSHCRLGTSSCEGCYSCGAVEEDGAFIVGAGLGSGRLVAGACAVRASGDGVVVGYLRIGFGDGSGLLVDDGTARGGRRRGWMVVEGTTALVDGGGHSRYGRGGLGRWGRSVAWTVGALTG